MICKEQSVFSCGKGDEGQLGLGRKLGTQVKPAALQRFIEQGWDDTVDKIICGVTQTFFLMNSRKVFVCGDNKNF
jgi:hypothetical protein